MSKVYERILFYVETPFQLFAALCLYFSDSNLQPNENRIVDCIVCGKFTDSELLSRRLTNLGLFTNVWHISADVYRELQQVRHFALRLFHEFFFKNKEAKEWFHMQLPMLRGAAYDKVIASAPHRLLIYIEWFCGEAAQTYFIEDGIGSYNGEMFGEAAFTDSVLRLEKGDSFVLRFKKKLKPILNALTREKLAFHPKAFYFFSVSEHTRNRYENIEIRSNKLPSPDAGPFFDTLFLHESESLYKSHRFIFLATTDFDAESRKIEEMLFNAIGSALDDKLLLRSHPRERKVFETDIEYDIDQNGELWEMLCSKGLINDDTILFSVCSSAQFTPKMLFNAEPVLVFLYELFPDNSSVDKPVLGKTIGRALEIYDDSSRIHVPRTLEELQHVVQMLSNESSFAVSSSS